MPVFVRLRQFFQQGIERIVEARGDTMNKETFGAFVSQLRKEKGLTQQALADRLHVTDKAVSKWERGSPNLKKPH